jgi:hypothetical protein
MGGNKGKIQPLSQRQSFTALFRFIHGRFVMKSFISVSVALAFVAVIVSTGRATTHYIKTDGTGDCAPLENGITLAEAATEPVPDPPLTNPSSLANIRTRWQIGYHTFMGESMSDSYDPVLVVTAEALAWGEKFGLSFDLGWMTGEGTPPLTESNWEVEDSWLKMSALSLGINVLYRFMNEDNEGFFEPYVSIGPGLWIGSERISATASRMPIGIYEGFYTELLAVAVSFGGSAAIGTTMRISGRYRALIEVRQTLTTSGTTDVLEDEEKADFDSSLYSAVRRPEFSFTGWRVDVGVQW